MAILHLEIGKLDFVRNKLKIIQIEFVENMIKKRVDVF